MPRESAAHGSIKGDKKSGFRGTITINGQRRFARGATKSEVQKKLNAYLEQAAADRVAAELGELEASTWSAAFEGWIASGSHTVTTIQGHRKLVDGVLSRAPWWAKPIAATTTAEINKWMNDLRTKRGKVAALNTKNMALSIARNSAAYALRTGTFGITANPTADVKITRKGVAEHIESLTRSETDAAISAAADDSLRAAARWALALHYGLRPAEVLALTLRDVAVSADWIEVTVRATLVRVAGNAFTETLWVRQDATKTRAGKRVIPIPRDSEAGRFLLDHLDRLIADRTADPLSAAMVAYVEAQRDGLRRTIAAGLAGTADDKPLSIPTDWVFPHPDHRYMPHPHDSDRALWKRICVAAGLETAPTRYTARHTAATHMLDAGADDVAVSEIMGHTDSNFTRTRYADALAERTKRLTAQLYRQNDAQ